MLTGDALMSAFTVFIAVACLSVLAYAFILERQWPQPKRGTKPTRAELERAWMDAAGVYIALAGRKVSRRRLDRAHARADKAKTALLEFDK